MIKEIGEFIFQLENKYSLFDKKINNVFYWKLIRFGLNESIIQTKCNFGKRHSQNTSYKILLNSLKLELLNLKDHFQHEKYDMLIIRHPRKVMVENQKIDIYSYYLEQDLKSQGKKLKIFESVGLGQAFDEISESSIKVLKISTLVETFFRKLFLKVNDNDLLMIESLLNEEFDMNINLIDQVKQKVAFFEVQYRYYKKMLLRTNPSEIYLVVSYGYEPLIAAAQDLGIVVTEMQHGVISQYHFGYSFPNQEQIPYFPNQMFLFGPYWSHSTALPLKQEDKVIYGNKYLRKIIEQNSSITREDKTLLIISQGSIGKQLAQFTIDILKTYPDLNIIYKLHPGEFGRWKVDYPELLEHNDNNRLKVVETGVSLYDLFRMCEYVLGVYSTAIYEALAFECKVALLNLDGVEHLEYLIENKMVLLVDNPDDLNKLFTERYSEKMPYTYYF